MNIANRVLIVDDDPPTCELIRDVLCAADIEAYSLTNSTAAATRLREQRFDAIFLDSQMPPPDGLELTRQVRHSGLNKKSLVVMVTGDREKHFMTRAFEFGVNFVLFKPVDRQALLRLLRVTRGPMDFERRRATRVNVQRAISIKSGQECAEGNTVDISANGMLVEAARRFPIGSVVQISLELDKGRPPLVGSARVMRLAQESFMALELETATLTGSERLQEFLLAHILKLPENTAPS